MTNVALRTSSPARMPVHSDRRDSDSTLVVRLQAGDADAYETLVREHGGRLLSVAR